MDWRVMVDVNEVSVSCPQCGTSLYDFPSWAPQVTAACGGMMIGLGAGYLLAGDIAKVLVPGVVAIALGLGVLIAFGVHWRKWIVVKRRVVGDAEGI